MKRHAIQRALVAALCVVAGSILSGCDDDGGGKDRPPANIGGEWTTRIIGTDINGQPFDFQGVMTIAQDGQAVSGSYTYHNGNTFQFSGTYVDGAMTAVDSDSWNILIEFDETTGAGTLSGTKESGEAAVETITLARPDPA